MVWTTIFIFLKSNGGDLIFRRPALFLKKKIVGFSFQKFIYIYNVVYLYVVQN